MKVLKALLILLLLLTGQATFAQQDSSMFARDSAMARRNDKALPAYLAVKEGLIKSDSVGVAKAAEVLSQEVLRVRLRSHEINNLRSMQTLRNDVVEKAKAIAATKNVNQQRKIFADVSKGFWELANRYKFIKETTIYNQQCPMTGVTWVSDSKEIKNPYYPKNMLTCGEVKGQL